MGGGTTVARLPVISQYNRAASILSFGLVPRSFIKRANSRSTCRLMEAAIKSAGAEPRYEAESVNSGPRERP
jgi:hypothetical protein